MLIIKDYFKFFQIIMTTFLTLINIKGGILMSGAHIVENTNDEKIENTITLNPTASTPPPPIMKSF